MIKYPCATRCSNMVPAKSVDRQVHRNDPHDVCKTINVFRTYQRLSVMICRLYSPSSEVLFKRMNTIMITFGMRLEYIADGCDHSWWSLYRRTLQVMLDAFLIRPFLPPPARARAAMNQHRQWKPWPVLLLVHPSFNTRILPWWEKPHQSHIVSPI